ncbi:MAG: UDP-N-acetylglucosamine--LPS N-acetylglucosamine transferase [Acidimicrobiales bacterium]
MTVVTSSQGVPESGPTPPTAHRVLFVSSSGGHLSQLLQLEPWWRHHDRRWVTFDLPDARSKLEGEVLIPAHFPTTRNLVNLVRNLPLAWRVVTGYRPDVVISNGAGLALPFFLVARLTGVSTVYFEVYDRIDSRSLTGRLCRPLADRFCVQWPEQERLYQGSTLVGPIY